MSKTHPYLSLRRDRQSDNRARPFRFRIGRALVVVGSVAASVLLPAPAAAEKGAAGAAQVAKSADPTKPLPWNVPVGRSAVRAMNGMVSSSQPLASQVGLEVLKKGGNAADAAIAMAAVLAVIEPGMSGLGGDAFALVYRAKTGEVRALNGSGRAPAGMTRERFARSGQKQIPFVGIDSVTVPGAFAAWVALNEAEGSRPLAELLAPAINYAEAGFPVMEKTAADWAAWSAKLMPDPAARSTYLLNGRPPAAGEVFRQPQLAQTLRALQKGGRAAFYEGEIGQAIAEYVHSIGGALTLADLAGHRADWVTPISTSYRGHTIYECPPNSQGLTALLTLNILSGYDLAAAAREPATYYHYLIEATRLAFADRDRYIADPTRSPVPVNALLAPRYAEIRRQAIRREAALPLVAPGELQSGDTTYVAVIDKDRNVVSYIGSLFMMFGSGVVAGKTGILLQDRGAGFSLDPQHPNRLEPGKRPLHTTIPALVLRERKPVLALGVVGGDMQPQAQVQILSALFDLGIGLQQALEAPRFLFQGQDRVLFESTMPPAIVEDLIRRGHKPGTVTPPFTVHAAMGGVQAVHIDPTHGTLEGASDPRKDGAAMGY